jgi:hypothetical protein
MTLHRLLSAVAMLAMCLAAASVHAAEKNIFDEDWSPPKPVVTPPPATLPVAPLPPNVAPPAPVAPQPVVVAPPPAPPGRLAPPGPKEQAPVRKVMKDVFGSQLADRTPAGRRKLAEILLAQADKSADIPTERYVVLAATYEASIEGGDLAMAGRAAEAISRQWAVDSFTMKATAVTSYAARQPPAGLSKELATGNVLAAMEVAAKFAADEDFAAALRTCQGVGQTAALTEADLRLQLQNRMREYAQRRDLAAKAALDIERLKAAPADPAANLAVGKYYCMTRNDWSNGLPMLARGSDPSLKALAAKELADPKVGEALAALADEWWEFATKQTDAQTKAYSIAHAADVYVRARNAGLAGLHRSLADRRIGEAEATAKAATANPTPVRSTVTVLADKGWQEAIAVKAGDVLTITATGSVSWHPDKPMTGPNGQRTDGRPCGCLMGQIGKRPSRELFLAGAECRHVAGMDGMLSFRIDDSDEGLSDNRGQFQVSITRTPASKPPPATVGEVEKFVLPATDIVCRELKPGEYFVTAEGQWSHTSHGPLRDPDFKTELDQFVAKFPDDRTTFIGKSGRLSIRETAVIRFKMRDDDGGLSDNRGQLTVTIRPLK